MLSRLDTNRSSRSRKRQKMSHHNEELGEPSTRSPQRSATSSKAQPIDLASTESADSRTHEKEHGVMENHLEGMRQLITCKICQRFLTEPYGLACGHTYCYICLDTWLVSQGKNTCPECRATVKQQPTPSLIIREMVNMFSTKQELLPEGESMEELRVNADEAANKVALDKNSTETGGLFKGIFADSHRQREPIYDADDRVHRCPICFHEIEEGRCSGCGERVGEASHWSDGEDLDLDFDTYDEEDVFGIRDAPYESLSLSERVQRSVMRNLHRRPNQRSGVQRARPLPRHLRGDSTSDSSEEDGSTDLEGFVVNDVGGLHEDDEEDDDDDSDEDDDDDDDDDTSSSSTVSSASASTVQHHGRATRAHGASRPIVLSESDDESSDSSIAVNEQVEPHTRRHAGRHAPRNLRTAVHSRYSSIEVTEDSSEDDEDEDEAPISRASRTRKSRTGNRTSALPNRAIALDPDSDDEASASEPTVTNTRSTSTVNSNSYLGGYDDDLSVDVDLESEIHDNGSVDVDLESEVYDNGYVSHHDDDDTTEQDYAVGAEYGDVLDLSEPSEYATAESDDDY